MSDDLDNLMDFASRTAARAGEVTLSHFGGAVARFKADGSEVTSADEEAEECVRRLVEESFPDDGFLGEESGERPGRSGRRWIVDPIDGTRSFALGVPLYAVLLALEVEGTPVLGCCHLPALGHTLVAAQGAGAWMDGRRASVSDCAGLSDARLVTSGYEYWRDAASDEERAGFDRLLRRVRFARTWGDAYGYFLVATGRVDLMVDPICGGRWDYAAMAVILPEAGARFTRFDGSPVADRTAVAAANPALHAAALRELAGG